jgi:hypothetical protein
MRVSFLAVYRLVTPLGLVVGFAGPSSVGTGSSSARSLFRTCGNCSATLRVNRCL